MSAAPGRTLNRDRPKEVVPIKAKFRNFGLVAACVAVLGFGGFAGAASASHDSARGNPAPTCPKGFSFDQASGQCVPTPSCPKGFTYDTTEKTCVSTQAAPTCKTTTDSNNVSTTICVSNTQASIGGKSVSSSALASGQVTILSYIQAKGMPQALVSKLAKQGECRWVGKGTSVPVFTNSGARDGSGAYGKFKDTRRTYICHTGKGPSGWQKVYDIGPNGQKEHFCDNYIWFGISPPLIKGEVLVVNTSFRSPITLHASISVEVNDTANGCVAKASAWGTAKITLSAFINARGNVSSNVFASTIATLNLQVSASTKCAPGPTVTVTTTTTTTSSPPPPPTTTTSPPAPKPQITDIYQLNAQSIYVNHTYQLCATVSAQSGDSLTVSFAPHVGAVSPSQQPLTGSGQVCTTYTAPGEVTTDYYTVYAHDNTNHTDATPVKSDTWQVQQLPSGP